MDLEKNKQRLEILAAEIEELKNSGGGGGTVDAYTKAEADNKFAEKTNVYTKTEADNKFAEKATTYTKTEVDEAIASAAGGGDVIVDGDNVKTKNAVESAKGILIGNQAGFNNSSNNQQISIGTRSSGYAPTTYPVAIGYQARSRRGGVVVGSNSGDYGNDNYGSVIFGQYSNTNYNANVVLGNNLTAKADGQIILGHYNEEITTQNCFIVANGTGNQARSNLFSFSNNLFYCGNDTTGYDLRYFAPADETLTDGGTISATALANANKHVPLSFNAHVCYYSYEDNDNVYYTSTRLNGTSLHTNVIAINKTTGVATFNEFDQS